MMHPRELSSAVELSDGRYWISGGLGYEALNLVVPVRCTGLGGS